VLGGQYGEITVAMQYGFQAWNTKMPGKWRDLLFGIGAEEFGHVEMLAIMIAQLLEDALPTDTEAAIDSDPTIAAVIGQTDVQHAIVAGAGARAVDSNGNPWQGSYITSGNLLADFTANANAEMQGRLQVARLYHMTDDHGVKDLLKFLLARDTMHQNQWIAAIQELQDEGTEKMPVRATFRRARSTASTRINTSTSLTEPQSARPAGLAALHLTDLVSSATTTDRPAVRRCPRRSHLTHGCTGQLANRIWWRRSPPR